MSGLCGLRGLVRHRVEGRTFIYRSLVGEAQVSRKMTDHLLERLFQGSLAGMVSHLLSTHEVSADGPSLLEHVVAAIALPPESNLGPPTRWPVSAIPDAHGGARRVAPFSSTNGMGAS